jgi:hypothetical protein
VRERHGAEWELWGRSRRIADALPLPVPFDVQVLVDSLAARRGRPIELVPLSGTRHSACGVLVSTDRADYIGYPVATTVLHQQHIVLHEIGHLLCEHSGRSGTADDVARSLTPQLSHELVSRVLGRTAYDEHEEQEAELIASLALQRAVHRPPAEARPGPLAGRVLRLGHVFGRTHRRRPASDG